MALNKEHPAYVIIYAAVIAALFTGGIMAVDQLTEQRVEINKQIRRDKALVAVFDLGEITDLSNAEIVELRENRIEAIENTLPTPDGPDTLYIAYDRPKTETGAEIVGYAFPIRGTGFWAEITGVLGVTADLKQTTGVAFLSHTETPGLGGRITTDLDWLEKWRGRKLLPPVNGRYLNIVKASEAPEEDEEIYPHSIDAISGATGTSLAVMSFINKDIEGFYAAFREILEEGKLSEYKVPSERLIEIIDETAKPEQQPGAIGPDVPE
ncbi:MAG: FMN-binding protein [Phycisphaerae bacterium]